MAPYNATVNPYLNPYLNQYPQQTQTAQTGMTPPTVHADIIQVENEQAALNYPVAAGMSQMMISKDETQIYVKTAYANAQPTFEVFQKRPPAPAPTPVDMDKYLTVDEFERRIAEILKKEHTK